MQNAFDSCKEVSVPQTGQLAMDLACNMPASLCDPIKWFHFMGDAVGNAEFVPFQITYIPKDATNESNKGHILNVTARSCSESYVRTNHPNQPYLQRFILGNRSSCMQLHGLLRQLPERDHDVV